MAYFIQHFFAGGNKDNYEATLAVVHPADGLPDGQIWHAAGPSEGGWTVMAVHDSQASWEAFRDGVLGPRLAAGIDGGFPTPPVETGIELHNLKP